MDEEAPVIYGLDFQARALCAHNGESEVVRFLVGTQSLKSENSIHCVEFDEESVLVNKLIYPHPQGEIWQIAAHPIQPQIVATVYNKIYDATKCRMEAAVHKLTPVPEPGESIESLDSGSSLSLENVGSPIEAKTGGISRIMWQPHDGKRLATITNETDIHIWDLNSSGLTENAASGNLSSKVQHQLTAACWSPHHGTSQIALGIENHLSLVDLRSLHKGSIVNIENCHSEPVRDIDFNPNRQYYMATCGDDGSTKFWDLRNTQSPVSSRNDHVHWVWQVKYNAFHDQLLLSSGSDARVVLLSATSLSSEPYGKLVHDEKDANEEDEAESKSPLADGVVCTYEDHEDSVYAVAWSNADPWTFASLSYGGRLLIHRVPRALKYRILL